ncbi:MAG TPA: Hsp70 family protein [Rhodococcus sp. (in: high G+C Gram-positive bacteria)]|nr:Hsp70 family protein [Rhodococcus sp. (in: high G+C Gram-positive bacteria)]
MTSVLGVSVGASAVRFARRDAESLDSPVFRSRSVAATLEQPEELVAESIETVLAETDEMEVQAIGVAYRNEAQADAVHAAMTRLALGNVQLVPEVTAALQMLETSGVLGETETLVFYDLGSSGLTVTVVDRTTAMVLSTARSDQISGDLVDRLIFDHQLELHRFTQPADAAAQRALAARCRDAKEQLSTNGAVCLPGEGGLLLLSQDSFDSLIDDSVKTSAHLAREVIRRSGRTPDAAVLVGGGANIPLVASVMESWLDLPVIVPAQPELVAAEGAALLARPGAGELAGAAVSPMEAPSPDVTSTNFGSRDTSAPLRTRRGLVLAGGAVAVVAAIALGLGTGLVKGSEGDTEPAVTQQNTQVSEARQVVPQPTTEQPTTTEVASPSEAAPSTVDAQPLSPAQAEATTTYQPQAPSSAEESVAPQPQSAAPSDTSSAPPSPEPAPLIPGLPQVQLPTLPPPPQVHLPELPRIPGL